MEKKILNVVLGGVINEKGSILLLKRRKEPYAGFWGLPGGSIEFGEKLEEAIVREIKEETNIDVEFIGLKGLVQETLYEEESNDKLEHFLLWVCQLRPAHFRTKESAEGELGWFPLGDLRARQEKIIPSDLLMIKGFFLRKIPSIPFNKVKMIKTKAGYRLEETDL